MACVFPDGVVFCAATGLQNHIHWEGRVVVIDDSETNKKKCTFLSYEAFSAKWEKHLFHCARTVKPFLRFCVRSDYLRTRTLIPVGITVVCGGAA